ncbi:MAG TPA: MlaD family protein [Kofleriaceae bacterium]|nr:MlaD family protein [Kofleriaceae bacterium]
MTAAATNFKLGVFAVAAGGALAIAALGLGLHGRRAPAIAYHTRFDESVQGLELGAPVKYRGVTIGNVTHIEVSPDHRLVDVELGVSSQTSRRLGLDAPPPELRARLSSQGLTGVKYVDLDFVNGAVAAAPLAPRTFASEPSLGKQLEDQGRVLADELHGVLVDARGTMRRIDGLVDDVRAHDVAARAVAVLDRAGATLDSMRRAVPRVAVLATDLDGVAGDARAALRSLRDALAPIGGDDGLVASTRRATDAIGELGRRGTESTVDLQQTLADIGEAARALRAFLDELERDPDMLVKGHAPARRP